MIYFSLLPGINKIYHHHLLPKYFTDIYHAVWKIIFEWILGKFCGNVWTGCIRLRIETSGGLLRAR